MAIQDGVMLQQPDTVAYWYDGLEELHQRIAGRFARSEARERAKRYLFGLLNKIERKNGWHLAEELGETNPQGIQRLLNSADWDADAVRDDLREYVLEHLGDEDSGILIVDETGFVKKGDKSVGVAHQYSGTVGDTVNCQVGVFVAYASEKGVTFIDRALYLPEEWAQDVDRRAEAGVPGEVVFENKIELAKEMLARAFKAEVPAKWVVADTLYGRSQEFREWLEEHDCPYAVMVPKSNAVDLEERREKIERLVQRLDEEAFVEVVGSAADNGHKRPWQWACIELAAAPQKGMERWLLVRRNADDPDDLTFYQAYGPEGISLQELVEVCQERWTVEVAFEAAKSEIGLDHYEVRKWNAWHRYVTLCLLAHAFLAVTCRAARDEDDAAKKGTPSPA